MVLLLLGHESKEHLLVILTMDDEDGVDVGAFTDQNIRGHCWQRRRRQGHANGFVVDCRPFTAQLRDVFRRLLAHAASIAFKSKPAAPID